MCLYAGGEIAQQISAVFVLVSFWTSPSSGKLTISSHSRREMSGRRPLTLGISWVAQSSKLSTFLSPAATPVTIRAVYVRCFQHCLCHKYVWVHPKANSVEKTSWYLRRLYRAQVICRKGNERSVAQVAGGVPAGCFQESRSDDRQVSYHLSYSCVPKTSKRD